jgi:hypothetical protein
MRNVFDQYDQPENRLTHALLSSLASDPALLRRFARDWAKRKPQGKFLKVFEQSLPGEPLELSEEESERRGLPDGCITDGQGWALVIESKIAAPLKAEQLRRHLRTAVRRGLRHCELLAITLDGQAPPRSDVQSVRRWSQVYAWLVHQSRKSSWARRCAEYFESLEASLPSEYLMKGTLTVFSGIPFESDEPYNYPQAKRLLGLLRDELRRDKRLRRRLRIDPQSPGRGAITGRQSDFVWDFIGLEEIRRAKAFTQYPHLTVGIHADRVDAYVTVPNAIKSRLRSTLLGNDYADFERRILEVARGIGLALRSAKGATPMIVIVQRHYPSQRATPVHDSLLRFDPRTAMGLSHGRKAAVKFQPQWLRATYDALRSRRSNLQFQVGAQFPYGTCPTVRSRQLIGAIAKVWLASKPIVDATTER